MESRSIIEQAKGVIIGERRCTSAEAFAILSNMSQGFNGTVRDIATELVTKATVPNWQLPLSALPTKPPA